MYKINIFPLISLILYKKRPHFSTREEMCIFHDLDYVKYLELVGEKVESIGVIPGATEINEYEKNQLYNDTKKCKTNIFS